MSYGLTNQKEWINHSTKLRVLVICFEVELCSSCKCRKFSLMELLLCSILYITEQVEIGRISINSRAKVNGDGV